MDNSQESTILDTIVAYHREQLQVLMKREPMPTVRARAAAAPAPRDFAAALSSPGVAIIAECKKASPSKGVLLDDYDAVALAEAYASAGAQAISVLTDARHFQGSLSDLELVRDRVELPVLRKDFHLHPYHLLQARAAGADAVLLIAAVLSDKELGEFMTLVRALEMTALVEVHDEEEVERALEHNPAIIGVNNRNLRNFEVDFENTGRLRRHIPDGILVVGESGLETPEDVARMGALGIDAVLVGETFVRSADAAATVRSFVNAGLGAVYGGRVN